MTEEEIEAAFKFLDMGQTGRITVATLKKRFGNFYNNIPSHRIKALLGDRHEITLTALKELVVDNSVKTFDPVAEAFKVSALVTEWMTAIIQPSFQSAWILRHPMTCNCYSNTIPMLMTGY